MKNFYLIFMLLLCEIIVAQGVVNSEKLFTSDVDKFSLIFSPSIDLQKGNSDVLESGIQLSSLYKLNSKHWIKLSAGLDIIREDSENVSNDQFCQIRHTYTLNNWSHTFLFYQLQSNFNLGVTKRELIGTGVRFKPIKTNKFKYDFGLGIMHEIEEYQIDIENSNMFRITSMSIMKLMFENFELKNITYYQPSFDSFSDFRVMNEFDISFEINNWLSYELNYIVRFDNQKPIFLKEQTDNYITSGFNFLIENKK